jgi:hypothetical protein
MQVAIGHVDPERARIAVRTLAQVDHRTVELAHRHRVEPDGDRLARRERMATKLGLERDRVEGCDPRMCVAFAVEREHAAAVHGERAHVEHAWLVPGRRVAPVEQHARRGDEVEVRVEAHRPLHVASVDDAVPEAEMSAGERHEVRRVAQHAGERRAPAVVDALDQAPPAASTAREDRERVEPVEAVEVAAVLEQHPVLLDRRRFGRQRDRPVVHDLAVGQPGEDRTNRAAVHQRVHAQRLTAKAQRAAILDARAVGIAAAPQRAVPEDRKRRGVQHDALDVRDRREPVIDLATHDELDPVAVEPRARVVEAAVASRKVAARQQPAPHRVQRLGSGHRSNQCVSGKRAIVASKPSGARSASQ